MGFARCDAEIRKEFLHRLLDDALRVDHKKLMVDHKKLTVDHKKLMVDHNRANALQMFYRRGST